MTKATCQADGCQRTKILARGLCSKHYARERRSGAHNPLECRWPGCDRAGATRGFCDRDYVRAKKAGNYDTPWEGWTDTRRGVRSDACRWPECPNIGNEGSGFCAKHWLRASRLGDFDAPWEQWKPKTCVGCGVVFTSRNRVSGYCSEPCNTRAWKQENVDRVRELGRRHAGRRRALILATTVEHFTEADIRARYGDDCYLCELPIDYTLPWPDPQSPSMDHIVPLSKGGTHTLDNVTMAHFQCNNRKNASATDKRPHRLTAT